MRQNTTILLIGALVAVLAIGGLAPVVSAHGGTDSDQPAPTPEAENATEAQAQYMAEWMATRMGPEGVEAFEEETGTTIEAVARAMAEQMGPWNRAPNAGQYGPGSGYGYQAPNGGYGPQMPCGNGYSPGMWGGHGMWGTDAPGMWGGFGPGMWGGYGPGTGYENGGYGPSNGGYGPGNGGYGPGNGGYGSGGHGHGMGGHGHGMGGGW